MTQEKKDNLESLQISKLKTKKTRHFCIVTYLNEKQLRSVLRKHKSSYRAGCYIFHDKDEKEPHFHVLLRTYATWTAEQISKWFKGYLDDEKKPINTLAEACTDMESQKEYIFHTDEKSVREGKQVYNMSDLVDFGFDDLTSRKDAYDETYEILNAILVGVPTRTLVKRYGKNFVYHFGAFRDVANCVKEDDFMERAREHDRREKYPIKGDDFNIEDW